MKDRDDTVYERVCLDVLRYAKREKYMGYSKFDALNSPLLKAFSIGNKWLRGGFTLAVNTVPLHIRPLLSVEKSVNPKGMALFASSWLNLYRRYKKDRYLRESKKCVDWLLENPSKGYSGICWGYNFDWQTLIFYAPKGTPNCVVTVFACEALLKEYEVTGEARYLEAAQSASLFLQNDLEVLYEDKDEKCISYMPLPVKSQVLNINALTASLYAKLYRHSGDKHYLTQSRKLLNYVVGKKTDYDAWYYTYPAQDSPIRHDNYHTGGILDALFDYQTYTDDKRYEKNYIAGLKYYRQNLFLEDGTPKWMNDQTYPVDVHGAAQGIISFKKASKYGGQYLEFSHLIADYALTNLYDKDRNCFRYRLGKILNHNYTLMRWCNAWMAQALSELLI